MDRDLLILRVQDYFLNMDYVACDVGESAPDILCFERSLPVDEWLVALCPDQDSRLDFLKAFDRAMEILLGLRAAAGEPTQLALALAFESTELGQGHSYRSALKKYSNSIVFDDVGIHLLLVKSAGKILSLKPAKANAFLRELDRYVALKRKKKKRR